MSALEKLAALRAGKVLTPTQKLAVLRGAPVPTHLLDQMGVTGAEIKRRAAAGERAVQSGPRIGTRGENMAALGIDAATGAAEGLGQMVGIAADAVSDTVTAGPARRGARILGRMMHGERPAPEDYQAPMPVTQLATRAADDLGETARRVTGLSGVDTGAAGAGVRFAANLLVPGPEFVAAGRDLSRAGEAARVVPKLEDVARQADADIEPALAAMRDQHAAEDIAAQPAVAKPEAPLPSPQSTKLDEVEADIDQIEKRAGQLYEDADRARERGNHTEARDLEKKADGLGTHVTSLYERRDALRGELNAKEPPVQATQPAEPPPAPPDAPTQDAVPSPGEETPLDKYARPSAINLDRLAIEDEAKRFVDTTAKSDGVAQVLIDLKGDALTNEEIKAAQGRAALLTDPVTREATKNYTAALLASRNELARMAQTGVVTKEYLELQNTVSTNATDLGRSLASLAINAGDGEAAAAMADITKQLAETGKTADEIVEALKDTDFSDPAAAAKAYKAHVKPKMWDWLDAYRYTNLLSSPRTHITNAFSNAIQAAVVRPADLMASGVVDWIGSKLSRSGRTRYVAEVKPYYRGMFAAYPDATKAFMDSMTGKAAVSQLDLARTARQQNLPLALKIVPRLLDAMDKFTVKLIEGGEFERLASLAKKEGKPLNEAAIGTKANATAREYAFRKELDPENLSGHGALLSTIDDFTGRISHVLNKRVGGTAPLRWLVPFIQTPMNIFKQGIEHSPLGYATVYKSTQKTEQLGRAVTGSVVFMGAGALAMDDRTSWAAPRDSRAKAAFYAAGYQPYAVKIGDEWISYTKLGPLGYPIALAAAMKYEAEDNPEATHNLDLATSARVMGAVAKFFSDQSYMQGIGDIVNAAKGDESVMAKTASNAASQLIPLSSLQRWVTHIIDPIYRKGGRKATVDDILQNLKRDMPWLSETVEPQLTPSGKPSLRQMPVLNAVSPLSVTEESAGGVKEYENLLAKRARARKLKAARAALYGAGEE